MKLTKVQQAIIIGTILGGGYLQKTGKQNARLLLEHSRAQEEYLRWKIQRLDKLFQGKVYYLKRTHPNSKRIYRYARAQSNASPLLGKIRSLFYPEGVTRKVIPMNLKDLITPCALAVWYMDDGYYDKRDKCAYLYLGRVNKAEANVAAEAINSKLSLDLTLLNKKDKGFVLYFSPDNAQKLKALIGNFVIESLKYKLPS